MENEVNNPTTENVVQPNVNTPQPTVAPVSAPVDGAVSSTAGATKSGGAFMAKIAALGKGPMIAAIVAAVVIVVGLTTKVATSTPKAIFKSTINNAFKKVNNTLDDYEKLQKKFDFKEKALYFEGDLKLDTNYEDIKDAGVDISKYKFSMSLGVNPKGAEALLGAKVSGPAEIDGKIYINDKNAYLETSLLDSPIDITELIKKAGISSESLESYFDVLEESSDLKVEDYEYIIKVVKKSLIDSLDTKQMKKSTGKMEVDGTKVSATKVSYKIDQKVLRATIEKICEELLKDDKFISKVSKNFDVEKNDIKEGLKQLKNNAKDIDLKDPITINIYVSGVFNKMVGIDLEYDDDVVMSIYSGKKKTEMVIGEGQQKIVLLAEEGKKETTFTLKVAGTKVATGSIREISKKKIDFDVTAEYEGQKVSVSMYFTMNEKKDSINGEYKYKVSMNDEYVSVSGNYSIKSQKGVDGVSSDKAIKMDEIDYEDLKEKAEKAFKDDDQLSDVIGDVIDNIEGDSVKLNYYGMKEVKESEAIDLLKKDKATVLYVGDTYYSSYTDKEKYDFFYNIQRAQKNFKFYSYYLQKYDASTKFEKATENAPYSCEIKDSSSSSSSSSTKDKDKNKDKEKEEKDEDEEKDSEEEETELEETTTEEQEDEEDEENLEDEDEDEEEKKEESKCSEYPVLYFIKNGKIVAALRSDASMDDIEEALENIGKK